MSNEELIKEIRNGKNIEKNMLQLYNSNLTLMKEWAKKYFINQGYEDTLQELYIALHNAVKGFDLDGEYKFTTYLQKAVINHLSRCSTINNGVKISPKYKALLVKYKALITQHIHLSDVEICCQLNCSLNELETLKNYMLIISPVSLDKPIDNTGTGDGDCTINDLLESDCNIEADYEEKDLKRLWDFVNSSLSDEKQLKVIIGKYKEGRTFVDVAADIHSSGKYASVLESKALKVLKNVESIKQLAYDYIGYSDIAYRYGYNSWKNNGSSCVELSYELTERRYKNGFAAFKAEWETIHNIA